MNFKKGVGGDFTGQQYPDYRYSKTGIVSNIKQGEGNCPCSVTKFIHNASTCNGILAGASCGGKYERCDKIDNCAEYDANRTQCTKCNAGYHLSGGKCIKDCDAGCSGYTLTSAPANANYSSCTKKNSNCSNGATVYKIDSCKSGYSLSNGQCVQNTCSLNTYCSGSTSGCSTSEIITMSDGCGGTCKVCPKVYCPDHAYMDASYAHFPSNCSQWEYCPVSSNYKKCIN